MSKSQPYQVADKEFSTKSALEKYIQGILHHYQDKQNLSDNDLTFMLEVLKFHPDYELKRGIGIKVICVKQNTVYHNKCFWLIRLDNSETDFSYKECLKPTSHEQKFRNACRVAIEPYTQVFKQQFFDNSKMEIRLCPYIQEKLEPRNSHVNHKSPNTFKKLMDDFILLNNLDIHKVKIISASSDQNYQDRFVDKNLEKSWINYHNSHAILEVISKEANLKLPKR
jgi:hypothetical protein